MIGLSRYDMWPDEEEELLTLEELEKIEEKLYDYANIE
jgi:hypothetical protein